MAMTRAQDRLILTTHGGTAAAKKQSRFVGEILDGAGAEIETIDRAAGGARGPPESVDALDRSWRRP